MSASLSPAGQIVAGLSSLSDRMEAALRSADAISFRGERMRLYHAAGIDLSAFSRDDVQSADSGALLCVLVERHGVAT